ncbi:MAG: molybdenum cofactor guanylyltransferase [Fimbriimonadaceae bacterium]|nr:molybdenum cofactor guanylyltransferase [Fimbriimonadaceae bacterium]
MPIEAIVLTGGASSRMGEDKAGLTVGGEPQAKRIADIIAATGHRVTILGRSPIHGHNFLADAEEFRGPLAALSRYDPFSEFVFVASCDMPRFDPRIVPVLRTGIDSASGEAQNEGVFDAAMPVIGGKMQPLCALYRRTAFLKIPEVVSAGKASLMSWLDLLNVRPFEAAELRSEGLDPHCVHSANTPEEFQGLTN